MVKLSVDSVVFSPAVWVDVKLQVKISVGGFEPRILKTRRRVKSANAADDILQELQEKGWGIVKLRQSTRAVPSLKICFECNDEKPRVFFAKGQRHEAGCCKACTQKIRPEQRRQKIARRADFESSFVCPAPRPKLQTRPQQQRNLPKPRPRQTKPALRSKKQEVPAMRKAPEEHRRPQRPEYICYLGPRRQEPESDGYDHTVKGRNEATSREEICVRTGPGVHHPCARLLQIGDAVRSYGHFPGDGAIQDFQYGGNWWYRISAVDCPPEYVASALLTSVMWSMRV